MAQKGMKGDHLDQGTTVIQKMLNVFGSPSPNQVMAPPNIHPSGMPNRIELIILHLQSNEGRSLSLTQEKVFKETALEEHLKKSLIHFQTWAS